MYGPSAYLRPSAAGTLRPFLDAWARQHLAAHSPYKGGDYGQMKRVETIQAALNVLNAIVARVDPDPGDVEVLRGAKGIDATSLQLDALARAVVQQYLNDARQA